MSPIQLCGYFLPKDVGVGVVGDVPECEWIGGPDGCRLYQEGPVTVLIAVLQMTQ